MYLSRTGSGLFTVPTSRLDDLSDSIMDKQALNEEEEFAWYTSGSGGRSYHTTH